MWLVCYKYGSGVSLGGLDMSRHKGVSRCEGTSEHEFVQADVSGHSLPYITQQPPSKLSHSRRKMYPSLMLLSPAHVCLHSLRPSRPHTPATLGNFHCLFFVLVRKIELCRDIIIFWIHIQLLILKFFCILFICVTY